MTLTRPKPPTKVQILQIGGAPASYRVTATYCYLGQTSSKPETTEKRRRKTDISSTIDQMHFLTECSFAGAVANGLGCFFMALGLTQSLL